jgi:ABC-type dipeptide/oligopeptide/nickel transport system ATPase component
MNEVPLLELDVEIRYRRTGVRIAAGPLSLGRGEILGLVGESGAGKSSVALSILRLLGQADAEVRGFVRHQGEDLLLLSEPELRRVRGAQIALLLQDAKAALNPYLRLETQFREAWLAHARDRHGWREAAERNLAAVGLETGDGFWRRYPRELSTGIAQRVLLSMVLLHSPGLLIADEPTSALDIVTQGEVLALLRRLNRERGLALLVVTHDLLAAGSLCDRIAVMKDGAVIETGSAREVLAAPKHPYVRRMVAALADKIGQSSLCVEPSKPFIQ